MHTPAPRGRLAPRPDLVLVEPLGLCDPVRVGELDVCEPAALLASPNLKAPTVPDQLVEDLDDLDRIDTPVSVHR